MDRSSASSAASLPPGFVRDRILFCAIWGLALILKLELATVYGTIDIFLYSSHGTTLARHGFAAAYASSDLYTIPPLAAGYAAVLTMLVGAANNAFGFLIRLPGIVAEAIFAIVLWRRFGRETGLRRWIPALFVFNPLSLTITGFHGNLDGVLAVCVGASLLMALEKRPLASGFWLGAAMNMKVAPVLLVPAFFFWWAARGRAQSFTLATAATTLAGWSPGLIACPVLFIQRCLGYGSLWGTWGFSRVLYLTGWAGFSAITYVPPSAGARLVAATLKIIILAGAGTLAWRRGKLGWQGLAGTVAATWTIFFIFAPGGATQYTLWLLLPLLLYNVRLALYYMLAALPLLLVFYPAAFGALLPWDPYPALGAAWPQLNTPFAWTTPALFLWAALIGLLLWEGRRWFGTPHAAAKPAALSEGLDSGGTPLPAV